MEFVETIHCKMEFLVSVLMYIIGCGRCIVVYIFFGFCKLIMTFLWEVTLIDVAGIR